MLREGLRVYENLVHVYEDDAFVHELSEQLVHHRLERRGAVAQAEEHYERFEEAAIGSERAFPLIPLLDTHIIVAPAYVEFRDSNARPTGASLRPG